MSHLGSNSNRKRKSCHRHNSASLSTSYVLCSIFMLYSALWSVAICQWRQSLQFATHDVRFSFKIRAQYHEQDDNYEKSMRYINMGFTGMFSVETVLKIIGFGIKVCIAFVYTGASVCVCECEPLVISLLVNWFLGRTEYYVTIMLNPNHRSEHMILLNRR